MEGDKSYCSWKEIRKNCPKDYIEYLISIQRISKNCKECNESCPRYSIETKIEKEFV